MNKIGKRLLFAVILCAIIWILPSAALANSAEPPSLVILVNNPPKDLSIKLVSSENQPEATLRKIAWEGYYVFYSRQMQESSKYTLSIATNGESFEYTIDDSLKGYNNVFTLDLSNHELRPGKYPLRSVLLVSIRLLFTILIEGIVFWLFRFRQKRSWIVFLIINLVTQGVLNVWLNTEGSHLPNYLSGYLLFSLLAGELFVFISEILAFPIFIKEHGKMHTMIYALVANFISLIAGWYIITVLPV